MSFPCWISYLAINWWPFTGTNVPYVLMFCTFGALVKHHYVLTTYYLEDGDSRYSIRSCRPYVPLKQSPSKDFYWREYLESYYNRFWVQISVLKELMKRTGPFHKLFIAKSFLPPLKSRFFGKLIFSFFQHQVDYSVYTDTKKMSFFASSYKGSRQQIPRYQPILSGIWPVWSNVELIVFAP